MLKECDLYSQKQQFDNFAKKEKCDTIIIEAGVKNCGKNLEQLVER